MCIPNVILQHDVNADDAPGRVSDVYLVDYDDAVLLPDIDIDRPVTRAAAEWALEAHGGAAVKNWPPGLREAVTGRFPEGAC